MDDRHYDDEIKFNLYPIKSFLLNLHEDYLDWLFFSLYISSDHNSFIPTFHNTSFSSGMPGKLDATQGES